MADTDISEAGVLDDDGEPDGGTPKKSGSRKLILFAGIALIAAGAAAGGWFFFGSQDEATVVDEDAPPVIEVPRKLAYIDLEPIFVQVETDKGVLQNVVVALALEVEEDSEGARRVENLMPQLYEAYLRTLNDRPLPGVAEGDVQVTHIKNRISAENLRLLGPGTVYGVVLRNIWITEG